MITQLESRILPFRSSENWHGKRSFRIKVSTCYAGGSKFTEFQVVPTAGNAGGFAFQPVINWRATAWDYKRSPIRVLTALEASANFNRSRRLGSTRFVLFQRDSTSVCDYSLINERIFSGTNFSNEFTIKSDTRRFSNVS